MEDISMGDISGFASFQYRPAYHIPRIDIHFNPGKIFIRDTIWDLDQSGITIDTSSVEFHKLRSATTHSLLPSMVHFQDNLRMNCILILRTWIWNT